jgi:hypothetical protein
MVAFAQLVRLVTASCRDRPNGSVISFLLFIHAYAHKRDPGCIRRNLWITDPNKIPEVLFGDIALLGKRTASQAEAREQNPEVGIPNVEATT